MGEIRVISGLWRGRRIKVGRERKNGGIRPTSDRVREALFMSLGTLDGMKVVDLYAGSGALGIEALSRGASRSASKPPQSTPIAPPRPMIPASQVPSSPVDIS